MCMTKSWSFRGMNKYNALSLEVVHNRITVQQDLIKTSLSVCRILCWVCRED